MPTSEIIDPSLQLITQISGMLGLTFWLLYFRRENQILCRRMQEGEKNLKELIERVDSEIQREVERADTRIYRILDDMREDLKEVHTRCLHKGDN